MKNRIKVISYALFVGVILSTLLLYISCSSGGAFRSQGPGGPTAAPPADGPIVAAPTCEPGYTEIKTRAELEAIGTNTGTLAMNYCLVADIDLSGADFEPIGSTSSPFLGKFDGNNLKITGLTIDKPEEDNVALFSQIGVRGNTASEVKNLVIENANIEGNLQTAILVGIAYATVKNVSVKGIILGEARGLGGLIGVLGGGLVEDSHTDITITVRTDGGGAVASAFIGDIADATVRRSSARGNVTHPTGDTGWGVGFAGRLRNSTIEDSYSIANISSIVDAHAFVYMAVDTNVTIRNCYAAGNIDVSISSSGFGGSSNIIVENSYFGITDTGQTKAHRGPPASGAAVAISRGANIMQSETGFVDSGNNDNPIFVGWDFTNVWQWTNGWPTLRKPSTP